MSADLNLILEREIRYRPAVDSYGWDIFLKALCDNERYSINTSPANFEYYMFQFGSKLEDTINAMQPWEVLKAYDGSSIATELLNNLNIHIKFSSTKDFVIKIRRYLRSILTDKHQLPIYDPTSVRLPIKKSLVDKKYWLGRLRIIKDFTLGDTERLALAELIGLPLNDHEVIPNDLYSREKWVYEKFIQQLLGKDQWLEDTVSVYSLPNDIYSQYRDSQFQKEDEKLTSIKEFDALIHYLVHKGAITLIQEGRCLNTDEIFKADHVGRMKKVTDRIIELSRRLCSSKDGETLNTETLNRIDESIERISLDYTNKKAELPFSLREMNPGTTLGYGIVLTLDTRNYLVKSGKLNNLHRESIRRLIETQSTDDASRLKVEFARTILGNPENFIKWKSGAKPAFLDPIAGGRYA
jgi:hypothetical protein